MIESQIGAWLSIIFMFEFAIATFLVFAARGVSWWKRLIAAPFSLGCLIIAIVFLVQALNGRWEIFEPFEPKLIFFLFVFVNFFGFRLIRYLARREEGFSCLGTIGRGIGCVVIGWALFALALIGIALMIGLAGWLNH